VIAAFNREGEARERIEESPAGSLFVPIIVLGELRFGAWKSGRVEENLRKIEAFAAASDVLPCDEATARLYGDVKADLRRKGRPIPENDIWISATALQHDLTIATRDPHFDHVEGLRTERW
jgi:tRNA(fMet)-specific endonuclease VapC